MEKAFALCFCFKIAFNDVCVYLSHADLCTFCAIMLVEKISACEAAALFEHLFRSFRKAHGPVFFQNMKALWPPLRSRVYVQFVFVLLLAWHDSKSHVQQ